MSRKPKPVKSAAANRRRIEAAITKRLLYAKGKIRAVIGLRNKVKKDVEALSSRSEHMKRNLALFQEFESRAPIAIQSTAPDPKWVEDYKSKSILYRRKILLTALKSLAVMEGVKVASRNLTHDYGFDMPLDASKFMAVVNQVTQLEVLHTMLADSELPKDTQTMALEQAVISIMGPERVKTTLSDVMKNLSTPLSSPFSPSNVITVGDSELERKMAELHGESRVSAVKSFSEIPRKERLARIANKLK
jgi:hypothetical protein